MSKDHLTWEISSMSRRCNNTVSTLHYDEPESLYPLHSFSLAYLFYACISLSQTAVCLFSQTQYLARDFMLCTPRQGIFFLIRSKAGHLFSQKMSFPFSKPNMGGAFLAASHFASLIFKYKSKTYKWDYIKRASETIPKIKNTESLIPNQSWNTNYEVPEQERTKICSKFQSRWALKLLKFWRSFCLTKVGPF